MNAGKLAGCTGLVLLIAATLSVRGAGPGSATKKAAVIERKVFDPEHLPTPAPPLTDDESAVCVASATISATFETEVAARRKTADGFEADTRVLSVNAALGMTITLWLPKGAPQWLIDHEETHRQIVEQVYTTADKEALAAARRCSGSIFTGAGKTAAAAEKDAMAKAHQSLVDDYNAHACAVWARVNVIFDDLTAHGRKSMPNRAQPLDAKTAMAQAFKQYAQEAAAATQPATRPATTQPATAPAPTGTPSEKQ